MCFMIGFFAEVGYAESTSIQNISDFNFVDKNAHFNILTDLPEESTEFSIVQATEAGTLKLGRELEAVLNEQYYYCNFAPRPTIVFQPQYYLQNIFSANEVSMENIWYKYRTSSITFPVCFYFRKYGTMYLIGGATNKSQGVYTVNSDGSLTQKLSIIVNATSASNNPPVNDIQARTLFIPNYNPNIPIYSNLFGVIQLSALSDRSLIIQWSSDSEPTQMNNFIKALFGETATPDYSGSPPPDNPYEPGGESGEGGGNGSFDDTSDPITDSSLPTLSSANTGFTRIYNPTLSQVQALAEYLWTDESVIQTLWNHIKQYFEDPMEAMIGFNLVPVTVPDGGTTTFKLMYIDTGVSMTAAASQFVDTDCGTLKLEPYYGSALDYSPYTKVSIFLPYIGMVSVDTDEVMGRTIQVKYRTDICSGACVAKILVDGNVLYQYTGHCAINIPFSAADFSSYVSAVMSTAKLAGTLALGASGALGPVAVSEITQQTGEAITKTVNTERNPETGRQITSSSQTQTKGPSEITTTRASYAGISPANVTNTVGEVISSKPHIEHSGSFSGASGYLGIRRPYAIIKRPNMCMPSNYQSLNGFPCMITLKLGDCKGFTRVQQVILTNMGKATNPEQAEIQGLLKNGVIL